MQEYLKELVFLEKSNLLKGTLDALLESARQLNGGGCDSDERAMELVDFYVNRLDLSKAEREFYEEWKAFK